MIPPHERARMLGDQRRAKTYLDAEFQRAKRADEYLRSGGYPSLCDVLEGLPPARGCILDDIRLTAILIRAVDDVEPEYLRRVEAMHEHPTSATVLSVWRHIRLMGRRFTHRSRIAWYAALAGDHGAAVGLLLDVTDFGDPSVFRQSYLRGLREASYRLEDAPRHFQEEILRIGACQLQSDMLSCSGWIPFLAEDEKAEELAIAKIPEPETVQVEAAEFLASLTPAAPAEPDPEPVEGASEPGHIVLQRVAAPTSDKRSIMKSYEPLVAKPTRLVRHDGILPRWIAQEWPHATEVFRTLAADLVEGRPVRFKPTVLVVSPGCGKTSLLLAFTRAMGLSSVVYGCASLSDNSFGGTPSRWSSATPSVPLELIRSSETANPVVILDELEKSGSSSAGSLTQALLPFLEAHTASQYFEVAIDQPADLSAVNFLATANSLDLPAPLRDRFRVLRMPDPGPEHAPVLIDRIFSTLVRERGQQAEIVGPLDPDEIDLVARAWGGGSLRKLARAVEVLIDNRYRLETRQ